MKKIWISLACACLLPLASCTPRIDQRGKMPDPEQVAKIQPGVDTQEDVIRLIGSPSSIPPFESNQWYYIHKRTETVSFFDPTTLEENILLITFDPKGVVKEVHHLDAQGHDIKPVKRQTESAIRQQSLGEQVFSVFGRFSRREKDQK